MIEPAYDVVVVGAGPAGSTAAHKAAQSGLSTLLIEKRQEIGVPVRCAEAVGADTTRVFIDLDDRWINARVSKWAVFNDAGDFATASPTELTLVVDRKVFDYELARKAARAGAKVFVKTQAEGLLHEDGRIVGVRIKSFGRRLEVRAKLVVAADGIESQVARWAGLRRAPPSADFYVGFQYLLGNLGGRVVPHRCEYHLGCDMAPGGYVWVFPKGDDSANVGLVVPADQNHEISAQTRLDRFVARKAPDAIVLGAVAGGVPATGALKSMVADGLIVVGDAAQQADPLNGGGIDLAMIGADIGMNVGVRAVRNGDASAYPLAEYERTWRERFGRQHGALYRIRKAISMMDEAQISSLIATASTLRLDQMSLGRIALTLLRRHPRLLIDVRALIATGLIRR